MTKPSSSSARALAGSSPRALGVEQLHRVELADGRAVRAFHVVGENLELGLAVGGRAAVEQHGLDRLLGVGLLRAARDLDLAEIGAGRLAVEHAADRLARAAAAPTWRTVVTISLVDRPVPMLAPNSSKSAPSASAHFELDPAVSRRGVEREDAAPSRLRRARSARGAPARRRRPAARLPRSFRRAPTVSVSGSANCSHTGCSASRSA